MAECLFINQVFVGQSLITITYTSDLAPPSGDNFLDIQATAECG